MPLKNKALICTSVRKRVSKSQAIPMHPVNHATQDLFELSAKLIIIIYAYTEVQPQKKTMKWVY